MESRIIKFRLWSGKAMYDHREAVRKMWDIACGVNTFPEDKIMEWTGLKDMNGKEIYEGDILTSYMHLHTLKEPNYAPVIFRDGAFVWHDKPLAGDEEEMEPCGTVDWAIVSGNIFENKDLL